MFFEDNYIENIPTKYTHMRDIKRRFLGQKSSKKAINKESRLATSTKTDNRTRRFLGSKMFKKSHRQGE